MAVPLSTGSTISRAWGLMRFGYRRFPVRPSGHGAKCADAAENIDLWTPYNFAYHGYWVQDPTNLNPRFGGDSDLKALSDALHDRGMWVVQT